MSSLHSAFAPKQDGKPRLCIGFDPSRETLTRWGLSDDPAGLGTFCKILLHAVDGNVDIIKPQIGYFERFGARGFQVLEELLDSARLQGLAVIADAKRGDIGSTATAYAQSWLAPSAPFEVDALTVAPYLGVGALQPFFDIAAEHGKYVFVVTRSSNPEGDGLQRHGRPPLWIWLAKQIATAIEEYHGNHVGVVAGATNIPELDSLLRDLPTSLCLAPGLGFQGARFKDFAEIELNSRSRIVGSVSRSVTNNEPDPEILIREIRSFKSEIEAISNNETL